jgi:hypothetical protein
MKEVMRKCMNLRKRQKEEKSCIRVEGTSIIITFY